jgi:histidinol dehydrogenase
VIADESGRADSSPRPHRTGEHDPGSCFLLTTSEALAADVVAEIERQTEVRVRQEAIVKGAARRERGRGHSSMSTLIALANRSRPST